jgi:hypothetical protein
MGIKGRLILMNFFQFFVWGAWLITIANYWFGKEIGTRLSLEKSLQLLEFLQSSCLPLQV